MTIAKQRGCLTQMLLVAAAVSLSSLAVRAEDPELLPIRVRGKIGFIDSIGSIVAAPHWDGYESGGNLFADWRNGHLWVTRQLPDGDTYSTFLNQNGQEITGFALEWIDDFTRPAFSSEGTAYVALKKGGHALIDTEGDILCQSLNRSWAGYFSDGLMAVPMDGGWGFMDRNGTLVIAASFDHALNFSNGRAWVTRDGLYGAIDRAGHFVVDAQYDEVHPFKNGTAWVRTGRLWGAIDKNGVVLQPPSFEGIYETHGDFAILRNSSTCGLAHSRRGVLLACEYDQVVYNAWGRKEHFFKFRKGDRWGLIDAEGEVLLPPLYDKIGNLFKGFDYLAIRKGKKEGLCDVHGRVVKPLLYDHAPAVLCDGLASFRLNGKVGYMDSRLRVVVPPQFEGGSPFSDGLASVGIGGGKIGYIDKKGALVVPPVYRGGKPFENGLAAVYKKNPVPGGGLLWGVVDRTGNEIMPCIYEDAAVKGGVIAVVTGGEACYADSHGKWIWNPTSSPSKEKLNRVAGD